jgi:hypothetical protein
MYALIQNNEIVKVFANPEGFILDGNQYSSQIFTAWSRAEKEEIGIYEIETDSSNFKDESYYINTNEIFAFSNGKAIRKWGTATAKQLEDVINEDATITKGLKSQKISVIKQQSSGLLELVAKPLHNLKEYMSYPKFNVNSKTITYTKSDNFYQYNTFWALQRSSQDVLFNTPCTSLSYDKVINEANMDYGTRSFRKAPLRAKELKVRHILDNTNNIHIVSQFILTPAQISYK